MTTIEDLAVAWYTIAAVVFVVIGVWFVIRLLRRT